MSERKKPLILSKRRKDGKYDVCISGLDITWITQEEFKEIKARQLKRQEKEKKL